MAAKNKPYEQFGPYILFKRLETDSLSELWRAGKIENGQLGPLVAVRRFTGGDRAALAAAVAAAREIVPQLTGVTFVRGQVVDSINDIPFIAHDYAGGRSLRHIVNRARGGTGITPNPIPLDQAIAVAEKVAVSLATTAELRNGSGARLSHGALIPQFVWISDDGEIRVAGQQLGRGIIASLKEPRVLSELGRFFSPEYRTSGEPSKTSDVFSMGALLYLLVTGVEPPDATTSSAFAQTVSGAATAIQAPLPDDIKSILVKCLALDPALRYGSIADVKQAISALSSSGNYSATTFNLAFYLSNLLKKEMESEALDREKEAKVNVAAYVEAPPQQPAAMREGTAPGTPSFSALEEPEKSRLPMAIAAGVVAVLAIGVGVFMMTKKTPAVATTTATQASAAAPIPPKPKIVSEPVVAQASPATATTTMDAEAARKKAFDDAVKLKYQEELMKLQADYTKKLQQTQNKNAPVQTASLTPTAAPARTEERAPSAAQLDAQRREEAPSPAQAPPTATPSQQTPVPAVVAAAPAASSVKEGDVVDVNDLDTVPRAITAIRPVYSPIAQRQRVEGTVLLTALVSESGQVVDVRVLKGVGFGLDEAAMRAMRDTRFSPGLKDGKRVKTWFPQQIRFKL
jgi:TonB family protein